jgi:hypothetical protein
MTLGELTARLKELLDEFGDYTRVEVDDGTNLDPIRAVELDPENEHIILIRIDPEATP